MRRPPGLAAHRAPPAVLPMALMTAALMTAALFAAAGCGSTPITGPRRPGSQPVLLAYGHSYVAGIHGQPPPWPGLLANTLHLPLVTVAHGGDVASRCLSRMAASPDRPADGDVVIWECDINDVRRYGTDPSHLESFRRTLVAALGRMRHGRVVIVEDPPITGWGLYAPFNHGSQAALDAYNTVIERTVSPPVHVVKIVGWDPATMLGIDAVHPNEEGKRVIADSVAAVVPTA